LTIDLMAEATKRHSHWALSEAAESLGSTLTGESNRDYVRLTIDTLPEDVDTGLALLGETLQEPAFEEADFQRLRSQRLDELRAERQNPTRLASLVGLRSVLGAELGSPVSGCPQSVKNLRLSDLKAWHQRSVQPRNTAVFVTGPITSKDVEGFVTKRFGRWKATNGPLLPRLEVPTLPRQKTVYVLDRPGSVQSAVFVVEPFPKRQTEGYIAREHLDNVLGGLFTSRINQNLRETHAYTYGARTSVVATKYFGLFTCSTSVATEVTAPALTEIYRELLAIRGSTATSPLLAEELSRSSADLVQSLGAHLENNHRLLADLEQLYYAEYAAQVPVVSLADVAKETERFDLERIVTVVVGDATRMKPELEKAGFTVADASNECLTD
jgi:zinc protease